MPIQISQLIRSQRKSLALIVKPDASLIVRAPLRASEKSIREFVENNVQWIEKKQAEALATPPPPPRQYASQETFMYLGNVYSIEIVKGQKKQLLLEENFKLADSAQRHAASVFERWYRGQARQVLNERVKLYADQYDLEYKGIKINAARSRWGSCSSTGSLNFSWRLIMTPMEAVDYVVVHELVHTIFHNHSKHFWNKVEKIMPDYEERRKWLRKNAQKLTV